MARPRILVVDDEQGTRFGVRSFLETHGYQVEEAESCAGAEASFHSALPDAAIVDYRLPDGDALDLLPRLKGIAPDVPVLILTGHGSIEVAVRAIKKGAEQFLTKPVELDVLLVMLERVIENQRNRRKQIVRQSRGSAGEVDPFRGTSGRIRALAEEARKILGAESPILIEGETGTGKGVMASWMHRNGPRAEEPFVDVNCAGLKHDFLESELFGHEKGAFTSASSRKIGLLEAAHRGTVFLDEIGDMSPGVQAKVLKVLEERRFRRLGDIRDRQVDIHLIAATHEDLAGLVRDSRFRSDLYYRINALPIRIPPLRDRSEDIPILARFLLESLSSEMGAKMLSLDPGAEEELRDYTWPGNIRELRNVLERAALHCEGGVVRREHLRFEPVAPGDAREEDRDLTLSELERLHISRVLGQECGHVEHAARRLGISRTSLYERIKRYGIRRPS